MRSLIALCLLTALSCARAPLKKAPAQKGPAHRPAVSALILLTAIIDRPAETIKLQRQYDVTPSEASTLVLALRPRWDRLIEQTGEDMESWTPEHMRDVLLCRKSCDCHFYLEVLEKRPQLKKKMTPRNLKTLERRAAQKNKGDELKCLERETGARRALIEELKEEAPDYGAESVY